MFPSTMAPKWPILVSQCEMDHQKPTILLIFGTLSLGGCRGHPMRPKLNSKDKGKMSKPYEYPDNVKSNLTCIFLSVRAKLKTPFCPQTPCTYAFTCSNLRNCPLNGGWCFKLRYYICFDWRKHFWSCAIFGLLWIHLLWFHLSRMILRNKAVPNVSKNYLTWAQLRYTNSPSKVSELRTHLKSKKGRNRLSCFLRSNLIYFVIEGRVR